MMIRVDVSVEFRVIGVLCLLLCVRVLSGFRAVVCTSNDRLRIAM